MSIHFARVVYEPPQFDWPVIHGYDDSISQTFKITPVDLDPDLGPWDSGGSSPPGDVDWFEFDVHGYDSSSPSPTRGKASRDGKRFYGSLFMERGGYSYADSYFFAFDEKGTILWKQFARSVWGVSEEPRVDPFWVYPHPTRDDIIFAYQRRPQPFNDFFDNGLTAINPDNGEHIWISNQAPHYTLTAPSISSDGSVLTIVLHRWNDVEHIIAQFDVETGTIIQEFDFQPTELFSGTTFDSKLIVRPDNGVSEVASDIIAYNISDMSTAWSISNKSHSSDTFHEDLDEGVWYVAHRNETAPANPNNPIYIYKLDLATGNIIWEVEWDLDFHDSDDRPWMFGPLTEDGFAVRLLRKQSGGPITPTNFYFDRDGNITKTVQLDTETSQNWYFWADKYLYAKDMDADVFRTDLDQTLSVFTWPGDTFYPFPEPVITMLAEAGIPSLRLLQRDDDNEFGSSRIERVQVSSAQKSGRIPGPNAYW